MVVDDFDVVCVSIQPAETDAPLVVDAYAVLSLPVTLERLQPITGRNEQVLQAAGLAQVEEFAPCWSFDCTKTSNRLVAEERLRIPRAK